MKIQDLSLWDLNKTIQHFGAPKLAYRGLAYPLWSSASTLMRMLMTERRIAVFPGTDEQPLNGLWTACAQSEDGTFDDKHDQFGSTPEEAVARAWLFAKNGWKEEL